MSRFALPGVADDDGTLLDGRIEVVGNDEVGAVSGEARSKRRCERDEAGVGVGGVGKLRGLRDIFGGDEIRLQRVVELEAIQRGNRGAAVWRAIRDWRWPGVSGSRCGEDRARAEEVESLCAPTARAFLAHR